MRKKLFAIAMTGIFLFFSLSIFAQSKTVTGTVTDKDGPVAGASVVVKGSNPERILMQTVHSAFRFRQVREHLLFRLLALLLRR